MFFLGNPILFIAVLESVNCSFICAAINFGIGVKRQQVQTVRSAGVESVPVTNEVFGRGGPLVFVASLKYRTWKVC